MSSFSDTNFSFPANCSTVLTVFYSDFNCAEYVGYYQVPDSLKTCAPYQPDTFMVSGYLKCVTGTDPKIDTNSTVTRLIQYIFI
jgi:hypothetical protein